MSTEAPHLVPGLMHFAQCHFALTRTNLNFRNGTVSAGDNKTEPCPNGCGPLWPVTWEQHARKGWEVAERYFEDVRMLNLLERMANQPGGVLLHDGSETGRTGFGLRPGGINRTLREALRQLLSDSPSDGGEQGERT